MKSGNSNKKSTHETCKFLSDRKCKRDNHEGRFCKVTNSVSNSIQQSPYFGEHSGGGLGLNYCQSWKCPNKISFSISDPKCYDEGKFYSTRDSIKKNCNHWCDHSLSQKL